MVKNVTNPLSDTMVINVPWWYWIWNAKRMARIRAYTSLGGLPPSKWEFPFLPKFIQSMTEGKAEVMIERARSSRRCVFHVLSS